MQQQMSINHCPLKSIQPNGEADAQPEAIPATNNDKRFEVVRQWLRLYLPQLAKEDVVFYCSSLIHDGFDSLDMLAELMKDDISFMKKAHKRVKLLRLFYASTSPPSFVEQSPPAGDVYTVDEAIGDAAQTGIEATISEGKRASLWLRMP
jgi:hypothetical protein